MQEGQISGSDLVRVAESKNLIQSMRLQQENLKIEQEMLGDKKLLAYLDNEALKMRLELASLLVENPQIVGAMEVAGTTLPAEQKSPIDIEANTQAEEPSAIPENTEAQQEPEENNFSDSESEPQQV